MSTYRRRRLLQTSGAVAISILAGCSQTDEAPSAEDGPETDDLDPALRINGRYLSSAFPIEFVDPDFDPQTGFAGDARIIYVHWHGLEYSHWHQAPLELTAGETLFGRTRFLLEDGAELPLGDGETFSQAVETTPDTPDGLLTTAADGDHAELTGETSDDGDIEFQLWANGELRWRSPPLPVEIR